MQKPVDIEFEYDGRPNGLVFLLGDRRLQNVRVRNNSSQENVMVKIQSTSSRKFRVRPGLALVPAKETLVVQIQLSPQETEPSECKFLVVVRLVDLSSDVSLSSRHSVDGQRCNLDEKALWQRAEAHHELSLVFMETVVVRTIDCETSTQISAVTFVESESLPASAVLGGPTPEACPADDPIALSVATTEAKAHVVLLLVKSQSRLPRNRLTDSELRALRALRASAPNDFARLDGHARRLRELVRQLRAREELPRGRLGG